MPYPRHWLFVMGGKINTPALGTEIWQCGIRGIPGVEADYGQEDEVLDNIKGPVKTWFTTASNVISNLASLEYLKLNEIAPDGTYVGDESHTLDITPIGIGGATPALPPVLTTCLTWRTAANRGFAHTGRIYPPFALVANQSMQLTAADQASYRDAGKRLLDAVSAASIVGAPTSFKGLAPRVVSSHGVIREITGVAVGSVIDVQRRRKNAMVETYSEVSWP